ncbi:TyeA family type III secretion system gatekeeper subunit [Noviherbaspirillum soli]|uniref:TyeA family type III secretion system gatekeeper subunit n=1 Tax=Noviherbaspirillum soli TaxID=1064518 RepID=UPI001E38C918|nr:TyeA family type III secretion system gatekeeper subunit [Noviherbaspirillum soli]
MHLSSSFLMMVEEFEMNLQGIAKMGSFNVPHVNGKALINELLDIIESGNGQPAQFEKMLNRLGLADNASASIVTLQGVIGILRTMPDRAYPSLRALTQLREAAQTVLEAAILREEEATS